MESIPPTLPAVSRCYGLGGQIKIVNLLVAIRNLRYGMEKGWHSKREMDLRGKTDLSYILCEFGHDIAEEQASDYSCLSVLPSEDTHANSQNSRSLV